MAVERWCEIQFEKIVNTCLVDPEDEEGQSYLALMEAQGSLMLPEAEALAHPYPYWTPPS